MKKTSDIKRKASKAGTAASEKTKALLKSARERLEDIDLEPIWKRVKKGLEGAVEAVGRGAERAAEKAKTLAERAGTEYRIYDYNRKLQQLLAELGGRVYDLARRNPQALSPTDPEVVEMIGRIRDMEKKIAALSEKSRLLKK